MGGVSPPRAGLDEDKGEQPSQTGWVFEHLKLSGVKADHPEQIRDTQHREMKLRLAREVGTGKRNLVEAVETRFSGWTVACGSGRVGCGGWILRFAGGGRGTPVLPGGAAGISAIRELFAAFAQGFYSGGQ